MKIALCHLELSCGPQERNLQILEQAVRIAAEQGADWVLTPEMAVQGYYFYRIDENAVVVPQPSPELEPLRKLCCEYGITLFDDHCTQWHSGFFFCGICTGAGYLLQAANLYLSDS